MSNEILQITTSPDYRTLLEQISGTYTQGRYPNSATLSHQLGWSHIVELLKIDDPLERGFYEQQTGRDLPDRVALCRELELSLPEAKQ
ncbi:hypothetical protein [Massilia cavernae]|uniref:hypothetical protein n=1 Tax=Massilia cavernae TaxID=2320864 RepID=UPI001C71B53A|nr:hypothetical protein [Massilia cavernae]